MMKKPLIILTGPTAVGKTELSIRLARMVQGSVISADSMQVYRHMDIGSAKITREEMQEIPGIGQVKAAQLKCVAELAGRIARTSRLKSVRLSEPASIAAYYMESLRHETKEKLLLAMFDARSNLLGEEIISVGTITNALVSPREIFMKAMEYRAAHIVLLHNHPSGDPTPSEADLAVTRRVEEGGKILEIVLADHIIIGDNRYISFRENGLLG